LVSCAERDGKHPKGTLWTDVDFDAVIFFELIVTRASGSISMNFLY
jgi:hypothetical protein